MRLLSWGRGSRTTDNGLRTTDQLRGIFLLIIFWLGCWFFPDRLLRQPFGPPRNDIIVLAPLTAAEKILFGYRLDINQLTETDWELLPGVGPATAKKIVAFRKGHGPFQNPDSLLHIRGIGPKTVERLSSFF